ncbi:hypothetical protein [Moraxella bovis]|uniref:Uncharacterized protein n=1 Tax=Moraxella bovis TaxID=476 RepID=A0A378PPW5_MORBO|nr:hypothetical protein [Moraxella bovis]STY90575.1 Uncharacterised protein [Moraxella bovis]
MKKWLCTLMAIMVSQNAFAQTYFVCTDTENTEISFKDLPKEYHALEDGERLFAYEMSSIGLGHTFFIPKSDIKTNKQYLTDENGNKIYQETILFVYDNISYNIEYLTVGDKKTAFVKETIIDKETDNQEIYHCDMTKPVINFINKL